MVPDWSSLNVYSASPNPITASPAPFSDVQEANANNEILITSALEAINAKLNQLGGSMVEPAYGSRGQEQVIHRKNFNLEA